VLTIQGTPKLSVHMPNREAQKASPIGMATSPPSESATHHVSSVVGSRGCRLADPGEIIDLIPDRCDLLAGPGIARLGADG
jgi:hypothetical protein